MASTTRIRLCSVLTVESAGRTLTGRDLGSRKARTLLGLLASQRGGLVSVDVIAEVLWPSDAPADPAANVATLVSRTRRLLGAEVLTGNRAAYGLVAGSCTVDLDEAAALAQEATGRLAAGESALAAAASRRALVLLGSSPALPDEPDEDWVLRVRAEADELQAGGSARAGAGRDVDRPRRGSRGRRGGRGRGPVRRTRGPGPDARPGR